MKVLHVLPDLDPRAGGPVTAGLGMARALAEAGVTVRLAATDHGLVDPPPGALDIRLFPCRFCAWRWAPEFQRWLAREAGWADLVHIHTVWTHPTRAAARASVRAGVPYVLRPAGMLERWSMTQGGWKKRAYAAAVENKTIRQARALHWTSEEERRRSAPFSELAPSIVVPHGVFVPEPADLPPPDALARRFPALQGTRLLLFLGRLHPKKQPDVAIRALAGVRAEFPEAVLALAGPGQAAYVESLRDLARRLGLERSVHFLGLLPGTLVQEALAAAACLVLPSRQENFGIAVAEAMAAGCPVVVSPEVALAGVVSAAGAGWVAPATPEAFSEALRRLLGDEEGRRAAGARARQVVMERYTWPSVARQLVSAYEGLLA
jgi:glycosyltransferase involved in cell wall biosynthesis